ncbi:MAG: T9SS type A sorting domain-containing protein [Bacteroidota bacterium]
MKRLNKISLLALLSISLHSFASTVIDTTTVTYDFNNLATGNLNGKDNWLTTKHNTNGDMQVTASAGYDLTNALNFTLSGPSVGVDASRSIASIFGGNVFSNTNAKYVITFDLLRSYWGVQFGIGADVNLDGKITNTDVAEKALIFTSGSQPAEKLTLPNGTVLSYPTGLTNAWTTVEMTLSDFTTSSSGKITIRTKVLGTSTWNTLTNNVNLGADTMAGDKRQPYLWKMLFVHFEGGSGKLDNISITRIGPPIITAVAPIHSENEFSVFPNPAAEQINLVSRNLKENTFFILMDIAGREVEKVRVIGTQQGIQLPEVLKGIYFYKVIQESEVLSSGKIAVN